ncbi:MAG TPA: hypothetical protein VEC93_17730, partial [Anaerolineae bacterium]|nr:hypothetical protein [Anaerolineae bacterium]
SRISGWFAYSQGVVASGNYAYVDNVNFAAGARRLHFISIANPAAPTEIGSYNVEDIYGGSTFAVAGNHIYAAAGFSGLRIINISNPTAPVEVGFYDTPGYVSGVAVAGSYAYVGFGDHGLHILDVSDPTGPDVVGLYNNPVGNAVAAANGYAYTVAGNRLRIINVSNPATPTEVGFYLLPGAITLQLVAAGNYVYIANGDAGLRIIDVSNPTAPAEISFYDTPGKALGVAVVGNYAYVADEDAGLLILRLWRDIVTTSIPTVGGNLTSTTGDTSLIFPSGTFTGTVNVTYRQVWVDQNIYFDQNAGPLASIDHTFELTGVYSNTGQTAQPTRPYTLTVHYSRTGPAIESTLGLYYWDGAQWVREPSSLVNTSAKHVRGTPNHFSLWSVLGETRQILLPVITR